MEGKNNFCLYGAAIGCCSFVLILLLFAIVFPASILAALFGGGGGSEVSTPPTNNPGELANVDDIPDSLKPIFSAAGKKFKVSPAFIAAIFYTEHNKSFPQKGPWASSIAEANGPFQFLEPTWEGWSAPNGQNGDIETNPAIIAKYGGYGQDGDNDKKADIQNLWDSAFAAAKMTGDNGAAPYETDIDVLKDVASMYNCGSGWEVGQGNSETKNYVQIVIEEYKYLKSKM